MSKQNAPLINQLMQRADIQPSTKDNSWDYLNQLSNSWRNSLIEINGVVAQAFQMLEASNSYKGEARVLIEGLQIELNKHATKWRALAETHANRTGHGTSSEEHSIILNTALDYVQSHEEFMSATSFAAPRLQELIVELEYKLRADIQVMEQTNTEPLALDTNI